MTSIQIRSRIAKGIANEEDIDKLELILKWLETPTRGKAASTGLARNVLIAEMEHLEGKGLTIEEARKKAKRALRK